MNAGFEALSRALGGLAARARSHLRRRRAAAALPAAAARALPLLLAPAALFLAGRLAAAESESAATLHVAALFACLLHPLGCLVLVLRRALAPVSRAAALALFDRRLELADRLVAADEFLAAAHRTPFMIAAIEDAAACAERARAATLDVRLRRRKARPRDLAWPAAAAALIACGLFFPARGTDAAQPEEAAGARAPLALRPQAGLEPAARAQEAPWPERSDPAAAEAREQRLSGPGAAAAPQDASRAESAVPGMTRSGRDSAASAARGAARAGGDAAAGGEPAESRALEQPAEAPGAEPRREEGAGLPLPEKKPSQSSGATASRGGRGGAARNPVASHWSTLDQIPSTGDEALEEEQDIEDESEIDEARGGMQPNLRDRRPPASRDLSIGQQSGDPGSGRGGPSPRKKSRGTASLVLGVPIPDQVKGKPNPGTVKITREQVRPEEEEAPPLDAGARAPRAGGLNFVPERALDPWVGRLVRDYFLELRRAAAAPAERHPEDSPSTEDER
ncbi:MAG: hypothetical protein HY812_08600 [Planctomycetes bacterium]|nr:hypothetical protein [Planctomycetota bacterium]